MKRAKVISNEQSDALALEIFSSNAFLTINKALLKKVGPNGAVFISNLVDKFKYFRDRNTLKNGTWFYLTHKQQTAQTGIKSKFMLRQSKAFFRRLGIIEIKKFGVPAKEYYRLNMQKLMQTADLEPMSTSRLDVTKTSRLDVTKTSRLDVTKTSRLYKDIKSKENKKRKTKEKNLFQTYGNFLQLFPPEWQSNDAFRSNLESYHTHRKQLNRALTPEAVRRLVTKLTKYEISIASAALLRSVENSWTGVFPESVREAQPTQEEPNIDPRTLIREHYDKKFGREQDPITNQWIRSALEPALQLVSSADASATAAGIIRLDDWLTREQKEPKFHGTPKYGDPEFYMYNRWKLIPGPFGIIKDYIKWIDEQEWLKAPDANCFQPESKVFKRFLTQYQQEINLNIFDGTRLKAQPS